MPDGSAAAERYFAALSAAFDEAGERSGLRRSTLSVGPWAVELEFAGDAVRDILLPSLAGAGSTQFGNLLSTIRIFDTESTGVPVPPFAWRPRHVLQRGEVEGFNDDRFRTIYHGDALDPDGGLHAVSMFDAATRTAIFWIAGTDRLHMWERAEPLRTALHWALNGQERHLAHAAAIGDDTGVVLLAGKGGAGKTTTTVACLCDGMSFVGDNYVLVSVDERPSAHALYANVKLREETLELLPALAGSVRPPNAPDEKIVVDVRAQWPSQLRASLPVRAIAVLQIGGNGNTSIAPASPVTALLALAPTTVYQLPDNGGALRPMADLVQRVPAFTLELGADPLSSPAAVRELLART
jgi:hypothetical protein